jgi:DNA modification methylase
MEPVAFLDGRVNLFAGDCLDVLAGLPENSVDSVVTDPPYGLEFMGKQWDTFKVGRSEKYKAGGNIDRDGIAARVGKGGAGPSYVNRPAKRCAQCGKQAWSGSPCKCPEPQWVLDNSPLHAFQAFSEEWARAVLRVMKPGAHLLAFSSTRTYHRMVCAIEDAGFEIRDQIAWLYGSGFPKSHDVSKGIDRMAGAERGKVRVDAADLKNPPNLVGGAIKGDDRPWRLAAIERGYHEKDGDEPATDAARQWQGWGSALKPALEPIVLARKPLTGTIAANVLRWGTGALNIDGCRVGADGGTKGCTAGPSNGILGDGLNGAFGERVAGLGRWPANIILDGSEEVLEAFPESKGGTETAPRGTGGIWSGVSNAPCGPQYGDEGSAARFFYSAKADSMDRIASKHPTVKPLDLMQYLCRLITPPNGTILDMFAGTGTTGEAAWREGFNAILIEREEEYQADIARRMDLAVKPAKRSAVAKTKGKLMGAEGTPLFGGTAEYAGGARPDDLRALQRSGRTIGPIGLKR